MFVLLKIQLLMLQIHIYFLLLNRIMFLSRQGRTQLLIRMYRCTHADLHLCWHKFHCDKADPNHLLYSVAPDLMTSFISLSSPLLIISFL